MLLAASFLFPLFIMRKKSATFDEVVHLPAGYSYLKTGLFKINPQHPPLIKQICALPLLVLDPRMPVDRATLAQARIPLTYQWGFGRKFLYSQDADRLLFWGRVPAVILSACLAALIMVWAGRLWGAGGGLLALFFYVFDPTLTAHAQLVTTDVGLALFATLFFYLLWRYQAAPSWRLLLSSGIVLGLALGAKFSAVVLIPMAVLLLGFAAWRAPAVRETGGAGAGKRRKGKASVEDPFRGGTRGGRLQATAGVVGFLIILAALVLWIIYFFPPDPLFYVKGLRTVNLDHDPNYYPYLMGEMKPGGWTSYFLVAWLVKTPLPTLLLLGTACLLFVKGPKVRWQDEAFLLIPPLGFFVGYSLTADNLGVRYLIPCFPFFFIFAARVAPRLRERGKWMRGAVTLLLIWCVVEFVVVWPDHLSYFNQIAGGSRQGFRWLDDSNVDWGQGLIQLREYLEENPREDYRFCYFGSGDPSYYGIQGQRATARDLEVKLTPGTWILSAHCLARARARLLSRHGLGPGNWVEHSIPKAIVGHAYYIYEIR